MNSASKKWELGAWMADLKEADSLKQQQKKPEEIERFTIDESLPELDLAASLFRSQHAVQRAAALAQLPRLVSLHRTKDVGFDTLVVPLLKSLPRAELSVQTSAGPVLSQLLLEQSISHARINDVLLPFVISMLDIDNDTIGLCYLAVLTDILHNLPPALLSTRIRQLSQLCLSKVNESQSTCRRVQGARLLGLLVTEMSAATIESDLLPKIISLCQDTDSLMRRAIGNQLNVIARAIGPELTRAHLLSELLEQLNDEAANVRLGAVEALMSMVDILPDTWRKEHLLQVWRRVCSDALFSNDVDETNILLMTIAKQIGEFLVRARGGVVFPTATSPMTVSDQGSGVEKELWQISQRLFKRLAAPASCLEARRLCAFNLPAVLLCVGSAAYADQLHDVVLSLTKDDSPIIRRTFALSVHELANLLGPERALKFLFPHAVVRLARDSDCSVQCAVMDHFIDFVGVIAAATGAGDAGYELVNTLVHFEHSLVSNYVWRGRCDLYERLVTLATTPGIQHVIAPGVILDNFASQLLAAIIDGVKPVQMVAVSSFCGLLRAHPSAARRRDLCLRLFSEVGSNSSSSRRALFLDSVERLLAVCSRCWIRVSMLLTACLDFLAKEPTPALRVRAASLLPTLKRCCDSISNTADAVAMVDRFAAAAARLSMDENADVRAVGKRVCNELTVVPAGDLEEEARRQAVERAIGELDDSCVVVAPVEPAVSVVRSRGSFSAVLPPSVASAPPLVPISEIEAKTASSTSSTPSTVQSSSNAPLSARRAVAPSKITAAAGSAPGAMSPSVGAKPPTIPSPSVKPMDLRTLDNSTAPPAISLVSGSTPRLSPAPIVPGFAIPPAPVRRASSENLSGSNSAVAAPVSARRAVVPPIQPAVKPRPVAAAPLSARTSSVPAASSVPTVSVSKAPAVHSAFPLSARGAVPAAPSAVAAVAAAASSAFGARPPVVSAPATGAKQVPRKP